MEDVQNAPLARYSTLRIGGDADRLCHPQSVDELVTLVAELKKNNQPWYVIGGGKADFRQGNSHFFQLISKFGHLNAPLRYDAACLKEFGGKSERFCRKSSGDCHNR